MLGIYGICVDDVNGMTADAVVKEYRYVTAEIAKGKIHVDGFYGWSDGKENALEVRLLQLEKRLASEYLKLKDKTKTKKGKSK